MAAQRLKAEDLDNFLDSFDCILLDCDGVIWIGSEPVPGAAEAIEVFRQRQLPHRFMSNNATASRQHYLGKFERLGFQQVGLDEVYTSGYAAATYLSQTLLPSLPKEKRKVYVIGQPGLEDELDEQGIEHTGGSDPDDLKQMPYQDFSSIEPDEAIGVVLQGFDMKITYKKLCKAYNYLIQNDCAFVATNLDRDVFTDKVVVPGEGALAAVLSSVKKPIVCGKPELLLLDLLLKEFPNVDKSRVLMIGDRLETDILMAKKGGIKSLLVLSGSSQEEDLEDTPEDERPDYVLDSLGAFAGLLKKEAKEQSSTS